MAQRLRRQLPDGDPLNLQPGEYRRARTSDGRRCAVCCPTCGHISSLGDKHVIRKDDGVVTPSYVCTHGDCSYHEFVILDGYDDE